MAAVASLPGLSQLMAWPTEHLTDAAGHWEAVAERNYGVANQIWQDASSVDWQGTAADALRAASHSDMLATSAAADQLQNAAKVARSGATDLYGARSRLLYAIEDAQTAGFDVDEEGAVLDRSTGGSAAQRATRQAEAQALAADIRQRAAQLVATDQQIAGNVTAAIAGIRDTFSQSPRIQAVDNHTFKQEPPPHDPNADEPWQNRPPPKTLDEARDALRQLQRGRNPPVREAKTPEELKEFWDWLTKGAKDLPPRGDTTRKILDDGTEVDLRPNSSSGGPTIEVQTPGSGKNPKVHLPLPTSENPPPATNPAPSSSSDHSWLPEIGHDLAEGGKTVFGWVVVGGVLVWTLLSGAGQGSGSAVP
jgi:hypothetical protein